MAKIEKRKSLLFFFFVVSTRKGRHTTHTHTHRGEGEREKNVKIRPRKKNSKNKIPKICMETKQIKKAKPLKVMGLKLWD